MSRTMEIRPAVARGLDSGLTDAEIAAIVGVTPGTVARHRRALGVRRTAGRPSAAAPKRSARVEVRVTDLEHAEIDRHAREAETSPGDWLVRAAGVRR